jgi:hypothetical protein
VPLPRKARQRLTNLSSTRWRKGRRGGGQRSWRVCARRCRSQPRRLQQQRRRTHGGRTSRYTSAHAPFCALPCCLILAAAPALLPAAASRTTRIRAAERGRNILYSAFTDRPKHLDPVQSYTEDEITFTAQIYEPPLQYHYLKRPYTLIPADQRGGAGAALLRRGAASCRPMRRWRRLRVSVYEIRIRPGIRYQPHPAFASSTRPASRSIASSTASTGGIDTLADFAQSGTRELVADDYIYQIKRLAHPRLHSPIFSMMAERIVGLRELGAALQAGGEGAAGRRLARSRSLSARRRERASIATPIASRCAASTRSSSTGWRCLSSRRCRARSTASTSSREWPRRT